MRFVFTLLSLFLIQPPLISQETFYSPTLSIEEFELLQDQLKERYLSDLTNMGDKGYRAAVEARRLADMKGALMITAGVGCLIAGGTSFYLSEMYYDRYLEAEFTADAIHYRRSTRASDFFKLFLTASGAAITGGSAAFFLSGPDRGLLPSMAITSELVKGDLFVR